MGKNIDKAGMWSLKDNPITHDGIFQYSGRVVDPLGKYNTRPDAFYAVYRPFEELKKACESFNGKPLINEHEMIGTENGITRPDDKNIGGTIYNVHADASRPGYIVADMTIFSDEIQKAVADGKKALSLGYWCNYEYRPGEYNGEHYDFVQTDLEGNHIALVDKGRMGSECRVYDRAEAVEKTFVYDSMEINAMSKSNKKKTLDADEMRDAINAKLKEATDEELSEIDKILAEKKGDDDDGEAEKPASDDDETPAEDTDGEKPASDDDETPAEDEDIEAVKDTETEGGCDDDDKPAEDTDGEKGEDVDNKLIAFRCSLNDAIRSLNIGEIGMLAMKYPALKAVKEDIKKAESIISNTIKNLDREGEKILNSATDSAELLTLKDVMREFSNREALYADVTPFVGAFDHAEMTARDVAKYAAKKMHLAVTDGAEVAIVSAFIAGRKGVPVKKNFGEDGAEGIRSKMSDAMKKYLGK